MKKNKFEKAYLKSINVIKEDPDTAVEADEPETAETPAGEEAAVKVVTFKTSDAEVLEALDKGFDEVVFFVKDEQNDDVKEVKVKSDVFTDLAVTDEVEEEQGEPDQTTAECGDGVTAEGDDGVTSECGKGVTDEGDDGVTSEGDKPCPECGKTPCECEKDGEGTCPECGNDPCTCGECGDGIGECNAFESAIARIKRKYLIK